MEDFISLGAGVQSTTMLLMACHGEIEPKPKYAIFGDTGWEPQKVYEHLSWLREEAKKFGVEVVVTSKGNIRTDLLKAVANGERVATLPFFIKNEDGSQGLVRRQCTSEYKIVPVRKLIRKLLGYEPKQQIKQTVNLWMGISTDEIYRVKPSQEKWITNRYPLIEKQMTRSDCLAWMKKMGYPEPPKSSCIGCPYHSNGMWLDMKRNDPDAWEDAIFVDALIKNLPHINGKAYLHRSMKPLYEVNLEDQQEFDLFGEECEGMCGV